MTIPATGPISVTVIKEEYGVNTNPVSLSTLASLANVSQSIYMSEFRGLTMGATISTASTSVTSSTITVSWTASQNTVDVMIEWYLRGTGTRVGVTANNIAASPYTITGLELASSYDVKLTPYFNDSASGQKLPGTVYTISNVVTSGTMSVTNLATTSTSNSVTLTWTAANYTTAVVTLAGGGSSGSLSRSQPSYIFTGLSPLTSYTFTVTPYNANGDAGTAVTTTQATKSTVTYNNTGFYYEVIDDTAGLQKSGYTYDFTNISTSTENYCPTDHTKYYFTVRWTGYFYAPSTGTYTFAFMADNTINMWIGDIAGTNQMATSNAFISWEGNTTDTNYKTIYLTAGTYYPVYMLYYQGIGFSVFKMGVAAPGGGITYNTQAYFKTIQPENPPIGRGLNFGFFNSNGQTADTLPHEQYFKTQIPIRSGFTAEFSTINASTNGATTIQNTNYCVEWTGYFYAPVSGTYTFNVFADNAAYVWMGPTAVSGYSRSYDLLVWMWENDYDYVPPNVVQTGYKNLTAGTYYPIRIQMFQTYSAEHLLTFKFQLPGGSNWITGGPSYFFRDLSTYEKSLASSLTLTTKTCQVLRGIIRSAEITYTTYDSSGRMYMAGYFSVEGMAGLAYSSPYTTIQVLNLDGTNSSVTLSALSPRFNAFVLRYSAAGVCDMGRTIMRGYDNYMISGEFKVGGLVVDSSNNIYVGGVTEYNANFTIPNLTTNNSSYTLAFTTTASQPYLLKFSSAGLCTGACIVLALGTGNVTTLLLDAQDNLYVGGSPTGYNNGNTFVRNLNGNNSAYYFSTAADKGFVAKYNSSGVVQWCTTIDHCPIRTVLDGNSDLFVYRVQGSSSGQHVPHTCRISSSTGAQDRIVNLSPTTNYFGDKVLTYTFAPNSPGLYNDVYYNVSTGDIYIAGHYKTGPNAGDVAVIRNIQTGSDSASLPSTYGKAVPYLLRFNSSGACTLAIQPLGTGDLITTSFTKGGSICFDASGNIYIAGRHLQNDAVMMKNFDGSQSSVVLKASGGTAGDIFVAQYNSSGVCQNVTSVLCPSDASYVLSLRRTGTRMSLSGSYLSNHIMHARDLTSTITCPQTLDPVSTLVNSSMPFIIEFS